MFIPISDFIILDISDELWFIPKTQKANADISSLSIRRLKRLYVSSDCKLNCDCSDDGCCHVPGERQSHCAALWRTAWLPNYRKSITDVYKKGQKFMTVFKSTNETCLFLVNGKLTEAEHKCGKCGLFDKKTFDIYLVVKALLTASKCSMWCSMC